MTFISQLTTKIKNYLGLVRFSHTIFALPFALASMLMAANGFPSIKVLLLILAAMVTARNSAMAFNRYVDRKIDAQNPRTQTRHLPSKKLSSSQVLSFIFLNSFLFVFICYFINSLAFYLSPVALGLIFLYSLMKRWTAACHFFLGLCLAISPVGAWIAVRGTIEVVPLLIGGALLLWVSGFDMIYSTLDADFDRQAGLFSFPAKFGFKNTLNMALVLHVLMLATLAFLGFIDPRSMVYLYGVIVISAVVIWEHLLARKRNPENINKAFFTANAIVSTIFLTTIIIEELVL